MKERTFEIWVSIISDQVDYKTNQLIIMSSRIFSIILV